MEVYARSVVMMMMMDLLVVVKPFVWTFQSRDGLVRLLPIASMTEFSETPFHRDVHSIDAGCGRISVDIHAVVYYR